MSSPYIFSLPNGITVAYTKVDNTRIVHCGVILDVGSRDEDLSNQGITHFWEHMAFKGTRKRKAFHIYNSVDSVGGELNAFTDKEKVVFYASVREQHMERAMDVLSDITFNSTFPEKQIENERGVILEEMAMYLDNPDDSLQDEFEQVIFKDHPMGMNILGRPETIRSFRRKHFLEFIDSRMDTRKIVFSCVGNLPYEKVEKLAFRYFNLTTKKVRYVRKQVLPARKAEVESLRSVKQARCAIGSRAFHVHHQKRIPFYLLVNLLGGPGNNSRLSLALREKHGYVYSIDAHYLSYSDTGMFAIFFGTESRQLDRCIRLVRKELDRLCDKPLTDRQLKAVKEQSKGQLAMAEENNLGLMTMMGRSLLDLGRIPSLDEIFQRIDEVDSVELMTIAREMFDEKKLSCFKMLPAKA